MPRKLVQKIKAKVSRGRGHISTAEREEKEEEDIIIITCCRLVFLRKCINVDESQERAFLLHALMQN